MKCIKCGHDQQSATPTVKSADIILIAIFAQMTIAKQFL